MEHVEKDDKPMLYLVFEYMDTDLKKYIDMHGRGPAGSPLQAKVVQVRSFPYQEWAMPLPTNGSFGIKIEKFEAAVKEIVDVVCIGLNKGNAGGIKGMYDACLQSFMYQLCTGLAHCHSHGVMHRCVSSAPSFDAFYPLAKSIVSDSHSFVPLRGPKSGCGLDINLFFTISCYKDKVLRGVLSPSHLRIDDLIFLYPSQRFETPKFVGGQRITTSENCRPWSRPCFHCSTEELHP